MRNSYTAKASQNEVFSKTGKRLSDITLEAVAQGRVTAEDIKISPETLRRQRDTANNGNRFSLADNFERAAELVNVPDAVILEMYNKLRPYRSTAEELTAMAGCLLNEYHAPQCAKLVRDALQSYEKRGVLK